MLRPSSYLLEFAVYYRDKMGTQCVLKTGVCRAELEEFGRVWSPPFGGIKEASMEKVTMSLASKGG